MRQVEADWNNTRQIVLRRDKGQCVSCGKPASLVHHLIYSFWPREPSPTRYLITLCSTCHKKNHTGNIAKFNKGSLALLPLPPGTAHLRSVIINTDDLLSVPQVAKLLGRPKITLYRWIEKGQIIAIELGGVLFIPRKEAERLQKGKI